MARNTRKTPARKGGSNVEAFLNQVAQTPARPDGARGRLVFALDATASREPMWDRACHIQAEMFREADSVGGLDIQLVHYHGFQGFGASPWISRSDELIKRMTAVSCLGGHTQIRRVLQHAIAETRKRRVNALVFVGDCMEENVDDLCDAAGRLGVLGVPAFIFQEGSEPIAEMAFRQIARLTRGAHCRFDASSPDQLRDLLRAVAVFAAGGRRALVDFSRRGGADVRRLITQLK